MNVNNSPLKLSSIVIDSGDSETLSDFYAKLLGWQKHRYDAEWIIVAKGQGEGIALVFQQIKDFQRPTWPWEAGKQQQMLHLDFSVDNLAEATEYAISCGAVLADKQFNKGWNVMLDPAGHPFCIIPNRPPESE